MSQLTLRKKVNVPADRMWKIISNYGKRPGLISAAEMKEKCAPEKITGLLGAAARWAKGRGYHMSLGDVSMPFKRSKVGVSVRHAGEGESEVTITMEYDMKYGPVGSLMNLAVMRPLVRHRFAEIVDEIACLSRARGAHFAPPRREGRLMEAKTVFAGAK